MTKRTLRRPHRPTNSSSEAGNGEVDRLVGRLIVAYIPLWLLGVAGIYWPLVFILLLPRFVRVRPNRLSLVSLGVFLALLLSIPVGVMSYGVDFSRVVSALGNGTVWLSLAALFALRPSFESVTRGVALLVIFQAGVIAIAAALYPWDPPIPLLHSSMGWAPSGVAAMADNSLLSEGWLGGTAYRSVGIMGNATWCGALGAVGVLIALDRFRQRRIQTFTVLLLLAGLLSVMLSLSRASVAALGLACAIAILILVGRRRSHVAVLMGSTVAAAIVVVSVVAWEDVVAAVEDINGQRSGSLTTRSAIYADTLEGIDDHPLPLLGFGVKPQPDGVVASVASHSTYLGLLFRAGAIGLLLYLAMLVVLLRRGVQRMDPLAVALTVFVGTWCLLEDFDTGHVIPLALLVPAALDARVTTVTFRAKRPGLSRARGH